MNRILEEYDNKYDFMYFFVNELVFDFYFRFGFKLVEEYFFLLDYKVKKLFEFVNF